MKLLNLKMPKPMFPVKIVYVWGLVFLSMVVYVFVWFSMGLVVMTFIDAVSTAAQDMWTNPMWDSIVEFCRNAFLIHPIIALVGWFLYGILNSMRRDVETWRQ